MQIKDVSISVPEKARLDSSNAQFVSTGWLIVVFTPSFPISMDPDFEHERTVEQLAEEQKIFLRGVPADLLDVPLPSDREG